GMSRVRGVLVAGIEPEHRRRRDEHDNSCPGTGTGRDRRAPGARVRPWNPGVRLAEPPTGVGVAALPGVLHSRRRPAWGSTGADGFDGALTEPRRGRAVRHPSG